MNVLYYFKEKDTLMDKWQRFHIFDELSKHDINITVYNPLEYFTINEANDKLLSFIDKAKFDLFMTPHSHEDIYIETLLKIKHKGIPTLLICFDNLIVPFYHKKIAQYFDLVWLTSKETEKMFIKWGANVLFNPYAANPYFFKPDYKSEIERIAFIGTPYGSRVNMINLMTENKIKITLYSNIGIIKQDNSSNTSIIEYIDSGFDLVRFNIGRRVIIGAIKQKLFGTSRLNTNNGYLEIKPAVGFNKFGELYSNYALSLSSTAARNTGVLNEPVNVANLRSFEVPMSGGLQICSYFDEIAQYFEEDKEIVFYRTDDEFVEKAKFYTDSKNESVCMQMKQAARKRAENEHTWFCRFKKVFDYFGLVY